LRDYLYYFNKRIKSRKTRYEVFETNQQLEDDMRSWKNLIRPPHWRFLLVTYSKLSPKTDTAPFELLNPRPSLSVINAPLLPRMSSEIKAGCLEINTWRLNFTGCI
jgi:hypothetical protein